MRSPKLYAFLVLAWMFAFAGLPAGAQETASFKPILFGSDIEGGGPYLFIGPDGKPLGFELDIVRALEKLMGMPIQHLQYDFASLVPGLLKGDFAMAMNGLEVTPERKEKVRFTRPYYIYRQQLAARAGEKRFDDLDSALGISGLRFATMEATAAEKFLRQKGVDLATYPSPTEAYAELALGRIDAVLLDLPMAVFYAKKNPQLRFCGPPVEPGEYAIAVAPGNSELLEKLNNALIGMIDSGELRQILEKWDLWDDAQVSLAGGGLHDNSQSQKWSLFTILQMLMGGALITIALTVCSFALAILIGFPLALLRVYGPSPLRLLVVIHVEFFRGIPVYLLLLLVYFGLPELLPGLSLNPFVASVIGLGLNYSAYESEIYRSALQTVPAGQWEAALSLGMDRITAFRRIIAPQAMRVALPPMTGDLVALFKDTSIAGAISLVELNKQYQILAKSSLQFLEIGLMTALIYLVLSVPLGWLSRHLEKSMGKDENN
jgi:polar amino acid transport system substrate-binding protein